MRGTETKTERIEEGIFRGNRAGFGFVTSDGGEEFFIPPDAVRDAFHLDRVRIRVLSEAAGDLRAEGEILAILDHGLKEIIGTFEKGKKYGFVIPDDPRILTDFHVAGKNTKGAADGEKVIARISDYGETGRRPEAVIEKILGDPSLMETQILALESVYGLTEPFTKDVKREAGKVPGYVESDRYPDRRDCSGLLTVTIDGEDARDLDDAISLEKTEEGYLLGVHIADVSEYVREGSLLDREAYARGTSVYFPDRVIPMLPRRLSNGICSLNAGELRLALTCFIRFNESGQVLDHSIEETIIQVDRRMTYTGVQAILEGKDHREGDRKDILDLCFLMKEAAEILKERRKRRGAIDFDFPESKIITNRKGLPVEVCPYERNTATGIIEDFMLLANETIAENAFWQDLPFLYRVHEEPDLERIRKLSTFVRNYGIHMKVGNEHLHPKEIQRLLLDLEGMPEEALISRMTLRSMQKARYSASCSDHFGLSSRYYTHFTSPIRRYPDLTIHRIIKLGIRGELTEEKMEELHDRLPETAAHCSERERNAEEAEREVVRLMKARYMSDHIGERYCGVISGVTSFGLFVELDNTVEGLVPIHSLLDDYYLCDQEQLKLVGEDSGRTFALGQQVEVVVTEVSWQERKIDFMLYDFYKEVIEWQKG